MAELGELFVKVAADTKGLKTGLNSAEKQVGGFSNTIKKHHKAIGIAMAAAGAAIIAMGVKSIKTYAQMGDEVQKMALRTGFSTEALSELRHAAQISGADLTTLEKGVKRMSGTILDASDGMETYIRAFTHIGLSVEDLMSLKPEEQFMKIAMAIAELEDPTMRAAIAQDMFGRAGTELLPLFAAGAEGIAQLRQEAHDLGIVFDQEAANKAAKFNDANTRLKESIQGVQMAIADNLLPILTPLIDKIKDIVSNISDWMKQHPELARLIIIATGVIGGLLFVLGPLLIMLPFLAKGITMVGAAFHFALGPIGIAIAVIGFLAMAWATNMGNIRGVTEKVIEAIVHAFGWMWDKVMGFIEKLVEGIAWVMRQMANFVNVFSHEHAMAIWNAADKMTEAVSNFRDKSVSALSDFDVSFQKTADSVKEGTDKMTEGYEKTTEAIEGMTKAMQQAMEVGAGMAAMAQAAELAKYGVVKLAQIYAEKGYYLTLGARAETFTLTPVETYRAALQGTPLQEGGIITQPTLAMLGERGAEAVIPLEKGLGMNLTINFTEPVFMEREESIGKLANKIYKIIKQDQRLSFGGAYSG